MRGLIQRYHIIADLEFEGLRDRVLSDLETSHAKHGCREGAELLHSLVLDSFDDSSPRSN